VSAGSARGVLLRRQKRLNAQSAGGGGVPNAPRQVSAPSRTRLCLTLATRGGVICMRQCRDRARGSRLARHERWPAEERSRVIEREVAVQRPAEGSAAKVEVPQAAFLRVNEEGRALLSVYANE